MLASGQYYGMKFSGHRVSLDQRSGLNLTPDEPIKITGRVDLEFSMRFEPGHESYFGYVFRIVIGDRNIDLIHGIFPENPNNFELILDHSTSKIVFHLPMEELTRDWKKFRFELDFRNQRITCYINDKILQDDLPGIEARKGLRLMFGGHSFGNFSSTDVPEMILQDIQLKYGKKSTLRWPLNETSGTIAHSVPDGNNGVAINPVWLLREHNTWNHRIDIEIAGETKTTFDPLNDNLYMVSGDTIYIYSLTTGALRRLAMASPAQIESVNQVIFDTASNRLLLYSLTNNYVAYLDFEKMEWSPHEHGTRDLTLNWHHNRIMGSDGTIFTFGGYGEFFYKNLVRIWNPGKDRFDTVDYKGGFHPRYMAGAGFNPSDSLIYIIGGFGSESGKQSENPDYYYELLSYSTQDSTFSREFEFQDIESGFCFASSVVFDDSNNMYALYFPKYQFSNKLQLVKVPLDNPEIIELGNPISFSFLDVNSFADLYFSKKTNALVALTSYLSGDSTTISVHSIAFPPQPFSPEPDKAEEKKLSKIIFVIAAIVMIVAIYLLLRNKKRKSPPGKKPFAPSDESVQKRRNNSIILFGGFQVIDQNGTDITGQFTPLPKKLFLFILLHSLRDNKGVSSNILYETFWFGKSVESARNNRAVNIVKLKSLLENLESASLSKDTGYWKFNFDPSKIYIDYFEYLQIVRRKTELTRENMVDLLSIIENRPFLVNTNAEWLDKFKSDISNEIIDTFLSFLYKSEEDPEFLLHLTNCIFLFDSASEEALKFQCRLLIKQGKHSMAKKSYSRFLEEYSQLYNEDYKLSFNQVIEKS